MRDRLERVILLLPFLCLSDVLSTLFADFMGHSLEIYEGGPIATFFARGRLLHLYFFLYIGIAMGMTMTLLIIKREMSSWMLFDQFILLLVVVVTCTVEALVLGVVVSNFVLGIWSLTSMGFLRGLRLIIWIIYTWLTLAFIESSLWNYFRNKTTSNDDI